MTKPEKSDNGQGASSSGKDLLGSNTEIGRKLKLYYDEIVSEEVPDRFADLLSRLEQAEPSQKKD